MSRVADTARKPGGRARLHVVVLAAGRGSRMGGDVPKAMVGLCGRPMLQWVLDEVGRLRPSSLRVVVGKDAAMIRAGTRRPGLRFVVQDLPAGTAAATMVGMAGVADKDVVMVVHGDLPLVRAASLRKLANDARAGSLSFRTMFTDRPHGYGRVVRGAEGKVEDLVVDKAATARQRRIGEVDAGGMAFSASWGRAALAKVRAGRATGEQALTDIVPLAVMDGMAVKTVEVPPEEGYGVNTKAELLRAEAVMSRRIVSELQGRGTVFADPGSVSIRGVLRVRGQVFVDRNVLIEGRVELGDGAVVGPNCVVKDTVVAKGASVLAFTHADGAKLGPNSQAGPFARLRPGAKLGAGAKVGNFVEVKNSVVGTGAKASHLAYIGDGVVGEDANIGAGTVFCNYDGKDKHRTEVGRDAFIGSGSMLVAPVRVGEDALVAAGSVITRDVADGEMAFGRARQANTRRRRKAGGKKRRRG